MNIVNFMQTQTNTSGWEVRTDGTKTQVVSGKLSRKEATALASKCNQLFREANIVDCRGEKDKGLCRVMINQGKLLPYLLRAGFHELENKNREVERQLTFKNPVPNRFVGEGTRCPDKTQLIDPKTQKPFQVHANRVELEGIQMICSQAPTEESEVEFWRAALNNTGRILDLTNKTDREEKGVQRYFPHEVGDKFQKQNITVACKDEQKGVAGEKKLKLHTYDVEEKEGSKKIITRLHYRGWPDYGAVAVKDLATIVKEIRKEPGPLWIHCRAGVGRTGTVAVALALAKMKAEGRLNEQNYAGEIDNLIMKGRSQRDIAFVQSEEQYLLLHEFARGLLDGSINML